MDKKTQVNKVSAFRFRAIQDYELNNLANKKLWMTNPRHFNDPYDCALHFGLDSMIERQMTLDIINSYSDKLPREKCIELAKNIWMSTKNDLKSNAELVQLGVSLNKLMSKALVACFSLDKYSQYMWSMYSDVHKGFSLEYGVGDLMSLGGFGRVKYDYDSTELYSLVMDQSPVDKLINQYVLTKHKSWEHENEWRLVRFFEPLTENDKGYLFDSPPIKGIYLGCRMEKSNKSAIIKIAKEQEIPVYQMEKKSDDFNIVVGECEYNPN